MGDKIEIKRIEFIYGHLFQIDYYNETKDYYGRVFIEKEDLIKAEKEGQIDENLH